MQRLVFLVLTGALFSIASASPEHRPDQFLVQLRPGVDLSAFHASRNCKVLRTFDRIRDLQVVRVSPNQNIDSLIAAYNRSGLVEFAEPDYIGHVFATPNDPGFTNGSLWALNNFGQTG